MAHPIVFGGASPALAKYPIANSVRFRGTASSGCSLTRTLGASANGQTYTISAWVKRATLGNQQALASSGTTTHLFLCFGPEASPLNDIGFMHNGGWVNYNSTPQFRDPSAWMHVVLAVDSTQAVEANRHHVYVNGIVVAQNLYGALAQNSSTQLADNLMCLGNDARSPTGGWSGWSPFDGYLADFHYVDGQALPPSSFGKFDTNGVWVPIQYSGTYGANGCKLEFKNGAALGTDTSGNGNHWTANGFTSADQMADSPTNNYATMLPFPAQMGSSVTISNGNLTGTAAGDYTSEIIATMPIPSTGKWYFETTYTAGTASLHGVVKEGRFQRDYLNYAPGDVRESRGDNGQKSTYAYNNTTYGGNIGNTGTMMCLVDMDNGTIYFGNAVTNLWGNGTGSFNQSFSNATPAFNDLAGSSWFPRGRCYGGALTFNFGQRPFIGTIPTGAKSLCTANLPAAPIANPAKHFNTALYTGNGTTKAVTGMGFKPGFLWGKERSTSRSHFLQNEVVGPQSYLATDWTGTEAFQHINGYVQSFDTDGFTLTAGSTSALTVNENNGAYVAWAWKAGGAAVTNTAGSVTSQVSANPSAGFSIVTATIPGSGTPFTIGHGLGAPPSMIISKSRSHDNNWVVYLKDRGAGKYMTFTEAAEASDANVWANTNPTSTVFSQNYAWYGTSPSMVFYCFAEIPGYSRFGSYTGNGNPDGPFVYCGFCPRWVMVKKVSSALNDWMLWDTSRQLNNPNNVNLYVDTSGAEGADRAFDLLSNGFKVRDGSGYQTNGSGSTYIFAAFAEHPFGGANVAPSPAR